MSETILIHGGASEKGIAICKKHLACGDKVICVDTADKIGNAQSLLDSGNIVFYTFQSEKGIDISEKIDGVLIVQKDQDSDDI